MAEMKRRHSESGPVGQQLAKNLIHFRKLRGKTTAVLADEVSNLGDLSVPMAASTVTKIETQGRRVTVDELVALAAALDVSPVTLMLPTEDSGAVQLGEERSASWGATWRWAHGEAPLLPGSALTWAARAQWLESNRPYMSPATIHEVERLLEAREVGVGPFRLEGEHDGTRWTKALTMTHYQRPKEKDDGDN